jgi:hypothetical protein
MATVAVIAFTNPAAATKWSLAHSASAPAPNARGLDLARSIEGYLLCDASPPQIFRFIDRGASFEFFAPIRTNVPSGAWGLRWKGGTPQGFWVSNYVTSHFYRVNLNGSVLNSFPCPWGRPGDFGNVVYSPWYVAIPEENIILTTTTTGSLISSFQGPGKRPTAACGNIIGDSGTGWVYARDGGFPLKAPGGVVSDFMTGPPFYDRIYVTDTATNTLQLWFAGGTPAVSPASLGRVKALFQ